MRISAESRATPHPDALYTALKNGEAVLLHIGNKNYYSLNDTGSMMWRLMSEGENIEGIAKGIHERYDVTLDDARLSASSFLRQLAEERLVCLTSEKQS